MNKRGEQVTAGTPVKPGKSAEKCQTPPPKTPGRSSTQYTPPKGGPPGGVASPGTPGAASVASTPGGLLIDLVNLVQNPKAQGQLTEKLRKMSLEESLLGTNTTRNQRNMEAQITSLPDRALFFPFMG